MMENCQQRMQQISEKDFCCSLFEKLSISLLKTQRPTASYSPWKSGLTPRQLFQCQPWTNPADRAVSQIFASPINQEFHAPHLIFGGSANTKRPLNPRCEVSPIHRELTSGESSIFGCFFEVFLLSLFDWSFGLTIQFLPPLAVSSGAMTIAIVCKQYLTTTSTTRQFLAVLRGYLDPFVITILEKVLDPFYRTRFFHFESTNTLARPELTEIAES